MVLVGVIGVSAANTKQASSVDLQLLPGPDGVVPLDVVRLPSNPTQLVRLPLASEDWETSEPKPVDSSSGSPPGSAKSLTANNGWFAAAEPGEAEDLPDYQTAFALTRAEVTDGTSTQTLDDGGTPLIASLDQLYGQAQSGLDARELARWAVYFMWGEDESQTAEQPADISSITVSIPVVLKDANNHPVAHLHSFTEHQSGLSGVVVLASHLRAELFNQLVWQTSLPETPRNGWLLDGQVVLELSDGAHYLGGAKISPAQLDQAKQTALRHLWETTRDQLNHNVYETKAQLQQIEYMTKHSTDFRTGGKPHPIDGQDSDELIAGGYGQIVDPVKYIKARYGRKAELVTNKPPLNMPNFLMEDFESEKNHCSLTAVTRLVAYYRWQGYSAIPYDRDVLFQAVKSLAMFRKIYERGSGTNPLRIPTISKDVFSRYGYCKTTARNTLVMYGSIKKSVDVGKPTILSLASGTYERHTVTVAGYAEYKAKRQKCILRKCWIDSVTMPMVAVYDGWGPIETPTGFDQIRYIDMKKLGLGGFFNVGLLTHVDPNPKRCQ
jgi:hypothetical protein